jgi:hypothetical protein
MCVKDLLRPVQALSCLLQKVENILKYSYHCLHLSDWTSAVLRATRGCVRRLAARYGPDRHGDSITALLCRKPTKNVQLHQKKSEQRIVVFIIIIITSWIRRISCCVLWYFYLDFILYHNTNWGTSFRLIRSLILNCFIYLLAVYLATFSVPHIILYY